MVVFFFVRFFRDGTILYFKELFVFETIDNAEQSFRRSRHDKRTSAILLP